MKMLSVLAFVGAVALGTYASAQDTPVVVTKPTYTTQVLRARIGDDARSLRPATCRLADKAEHFVTTEVALGGRTYRCVTVVDVDFNPVGAGWTPVQQ
jgi:hypothetical protein